MKSVCPCFPAIFAVAALMLGGSPVAAQKPDPAIIRGESAQTRKRLAEAEQKVLTGKAADAVDDLQRILDEASTDLITLDGKLFRPAPWFAQQILCKLPPEVLNNYQNQVESPARKLLEAAKRSREPSTLWQLLDRYFVSRPTDEGLLLLGDLLFERGEFRTAELVWSRLLPARSPDFAYPHSQTPPALVSARIILAAIFQGELARATSELAAFQLNYPGANGSIAGKTGPLASILQEQLQNPPHFQNAGETGQDWPAFGGGPAHSGSLSVRLPAEWNIKPKVEHVVTLPHSPRQAPFRHSQLTPFGHPVVAAGHLYVTDGHLLFSYNLATGRSDQELLPHSKALTYKGDRPPPEPCPSLTVAAGRLYVRTGPPLFHASSSGIGKAEESAIVCYAIPKETGDGLTKLWELKPPAGNGQSPTIWEGAPQVKDRRLWAAYTRLESGRSIHGIACYDPADTETTPDRPAWVTEICESPLSAAGENRTRQELVTVAGRMVYFCTNTGAIAALDSATGRRGWVFRYPRSSLASPNRFSDPAPVVACNGRLFVAPTDAEHVYALDPDSGEMLWESSLMLGAQILGVAGNRVMVSVTEHSHGLRGLDVATGSYHEPAGMISHDLNVLPGRGRGFVTDQVVFWPSSSGLWLFNPKNGEIVLSPFCSPVDSQRSPFGNVIYADGMLFVVTATQLWIYLSEKKEFGSLEEQSARGDSAFLRFNRAVAKAERALAERQTALAKKTLLDLARSTLPAPYRAWCLARLGTLDQSGEWGVEVSKLLTPELSNEWVISAAGLPITLGALLRPTVRMEPIGAATPGKNASLLEIDEEHLKRPFVGEKSRSLTVPVGMGPLLAIPGMNQPRHVYLGGHAQIVRISLDAGKQSRFQGDATFTHAADLREGFVAAGPFAIVLYGAGQAPVWRFQVPITEPLPQSIGEFRIVHAHQQAPSELSGFRICGSWVVARLGRHCLIGIDLDRRCVAWVLGSDGLPGYRLASTQVFPQFFDEYSVSPGGIAVQLSNRQCWFVSLETGRLLGRDLASRARNWLQSVWVSGREAQGKSTDFSRTAATAWITPPTHLASDDWVVADGPGQLRLRVPLTRLIRWTYEDPRRVSSLRGECAQTRAWGRNLIVALACNEGVELDHVDPRTGKSIGDWHDGRVFLDCDRIWLDHADATHDLLVVPAGNQVLAIEWATGKIAWQRELPSLSGVRGWVVHAGRKSLIVHPAESIPREPLHQVANRLLHSFLEVPDPARLPLAALGLYDDWITRSFPVFVLDKETGHQLGKVVVPARGPAAMVTWGRDGIVVATGDQVCWIQ